MVYWISVVFLEIVLRISSMVDSGKCEKTRSGKKQEKDHNLLIINFFYSSKQIFTFQFSTSSWYIIAQSTRTSFLKVLQYFFMIQRFQVHYILSSFMISSNCTIHNLARYFLLNTLTFHFSTLSWYTDLKSIKYAHIFCKLLRILFAYSSEGAYTQFKSSFHSLSKHIRSLFHLVVILSLTWGSQSWIASRLRLVDTKN